MGSDEGMVPNRYRVWDAYTKAEFQHHFANGSRQERLQLLAECYADGGYLPYKLASLVLEDSDPEIRLWMAKNARYLDYRPVDKNPDGNLWERLSRDESPLVSAALYENSNAFAFDVGTDTFPKLPQMCRLAYVRSPIHGRCLVSRWAELLLAIFDPSNKSLELVDGDRTDLARAYLTNPAVLAQARSHRCSPEPPWWEMECGQNRHRLWELTCAFPIRRVVETAFEHFAPHASEEVRLSAYSSTGSSDLRYIILLGARPNDTNLWELASADEDALCRNLAKLHKKNS
jgi:hypothetical protein